MALRQSLKQINHQVSWCFPGLKRWYIKVFVVVAGMAPDILLGWEDMKKLDMIPKGFPARIEKVTCVKDDWAYTMPGEEPKQETYEKKMPLKCR